MKRIAAVLMTVVLVFFVFNMLAWAQEKTTTEQPATKEAPAKMAMHKYVGSQACKMCHNTEASGKQYDKWMASPHAKAYAVLADSEALVVGKKAGVDKPQESAQCLGCHETGYSAPAEQKEATLKMTEGVGCEVCHGPGSDYKSMSVMKDKAKAMAAGLMMPDEKTCVGNCHNEKSPTYKPFVFADAAKIIAHPIPKKETVKEEKKETPTKK